MAEFEPENLECSLNPYLYKLLTHWPWTGPTYDPEVNELGPLASRSQVQP